MQRTELHAGESYPLVPSYTQYAGIYDELGQAEFSRALIPLVGLAIHRHGVQVRAALDLACGTGAAALLLSERGYQVTGVDISAEMLEIARGKSEQAGFSIAFLQQDLAHLQLNTQVELAVCLYDSLNYLLSPEALASAFRAVGTLLSPGGLFVFDMNTPHCICQDWGNGCAEEVSPSARLLHLYSYDEDSGIGTLELRVIAEQGGRAVSFREIHQERGYSEREVREALRGSGLHLLETFSFPDLAPPDEGTSRIIYVAGKEAGNARASGGDEQPNPGATP